MRNVTRYVAALLFVSTAAPAAAQLRIDQSTTLDATIEEDIDIFSGGGPRTVVEVVAPASLRGQTRLFEASELRVTGGEALTIEAYDASFINYASDRWASGLEMHDSSTGTVAGGVNDVFTYGSSTLAMLDGAVGEIWSAHEQSTIDIYAGRSEFLQSHDISRINIFGGSFSPSARDASTVNIFGGTIGSLSAGWETGAHTAVIRIVGGNFNYPYGPIPDGTGRLTGVLSSGEAIDAPFEIYSNASIVLTLPEPGSLVLLATAGLLVLGRTKLRRTAELTPDLDFCERAQQRSWRHGLRLVDENPEGRVARAS